MLLGCNNYAAWCCFLSTNVSNLPNKQMKAGCLRQGYPFNPFDPCSKNTRDLRGFK